MEEPPIVVHTLAEVRANVIRRKTALMEKLPEFELRAVSSKPNWPWTGKIATVAQFLGVLCYVSDREQEPLLAVGTAGPNCHATKFTFAIAANFEDERSLRVPVCALSTAPCPLPNGVIVYDPKRILDSKRISAATDWMTMFAAREIKLEPGRGLVLNKRYPNLPAVWSADAYFFTQGTSCTQVSPGEVVAKFPEIPVRLAETDPCAICGSDGAVGLIELKAPRACFNICVLCAVGSGRALGKVSLRAPPIPELLPLQDIKRDFAINRVARQYVANKRIVGSDAVFVRRADLSIGFELAAGERQLFVVNAPIVILTATEFI